jgi:tyrosinase-like protein
MGIRKNQNKLTDQEKTRYVNAVLKMKALGTYNPFVLIHNEVFNPTGLIDPNTGLVDPNRNPAHRCPAFLPWHRYFILKFETALKAADTALGGNGDISLPYWDWTYDNAGEANKQRGSIWKFLGGNGDPVTTGPFKQGEWALADGTPLRREFGKFALSLPAEKEIEDALEIKGFDCPLFDSSAATVGPASVSAGPSIAIPNAPTITGTTGGTLAAGTYRVLITYRNTLGETRPSPEAIITLASPNNAIRVSSPPMRPSATGYQVYLTAANGNTPTVQGSMQAIGSQVTIASSSVGAPLPTMNSTGSFRNVLEGFVTPRKEAESHNRVHVWVGGSMAPNTSPNDPVFFLHHCNIDRLWALWQFKNPGQNYPTTGQVNHRLDGEMVPWTTAMSPGEVKKPSDVLNHVALGYTYDTDPPGMSFSIIP